MTSYLYVTGNYENSVSVYQRNSVQVHCFWQKFCVMTTKEQTDSINTLVLTLSPGGITYMLSVTVIMRFL